MTSVLLTIIAALGYDTTQLGNSAHRPWVNGKQVEEFLQDYQKRTATCDSKGKAPSTKPASIVARCIRATTAGLKRILNLLTVKK